MHRRQRQLRENKLMTVSLCKGYLQKIIEEH